MRHSHWPQYSDEEVSAVSEVLRSGKVNYWTGTECLTFEEEFAQYCGTTRAVAVANGTVALELALRALQIAPGDEVIVTSRSFVASALAILTVGAVPVFADVDLQSQNITPETILPCITEKTRAILVVHLAGWPCEMEPILQMARAHDLKVIEDCAQAHGAEYQGKKVGAFADIACFSFCQDKIISTGGEGGMLTTSDDRLWRLLWQYKDHGKRTACLEKTSSNSFQYVHDSWGTNARMTEMQAAIGRLQLKHLDDWVNIRNRNAQILLGAFKGTPGLRVHCPPSTVKHAYYKFYTFIDTDRLKTGWSRDRIIAEVYQRGGLCFSGSCPEIYREEVFKDYTDGRNIPKPNAKELGETSLMLLVDHTIEPYQLESNADTIKAVMQDATN